MLTLKPNQQHHEITKVPLVFDAHFHVHMGNELVVGKGTKRLWIGIFHHLHSVHTGSLNFISIVEIGKNSGCY